MTIILLLLFLLSAQVLYAQGKITGNLTDSASASPIDRLTVDLQGPGRV